MFHLRLIIFWYIFLTFLVAFSSITIGFIDFLPGLSLIWILLVIFLAGTKLKLPGNINVADKSGHQFKSTTILYLSIAFAFIIFFPFYIKYYTGSTIYLVFFNLVTGNSNYLSYQEHFANEALDVFSLTKLPFIVGAGVLKFLFLTCVCRLMGFKSRRNYVEALAITIMVLVTIVLAVSRGTSFEFFELGVLFIFAILLRRRRLELNNWFRGKTMLLVSVVSILILMVFSYNINARGEFNCLGEMCFDDQGVLALISPQIGHISFKLSGYFGFGLFIISKSLTLINAGSLEGFFALFLPMGTSLFNMGGNYSFIVCGSLIDCSVAWKPDLLLFLNNFGLIGTIILVLLLGAFSKRIFYKAVNGSIPSSVLLYFVFLFMISLPVGSFITVSSANVISILCAVSLYIFPGLGRLFFGLFDQNNID